MTTEQMTKSLKESITKLEKALEIIDRCNEAVKEMNNGIK